MTNRNDRLFPKYLICRNALHALAGKMPAMARDHCAVRPPDGPDLDVVFRYDEAHAMAGLLAG